MITVVYSKDEKQNNEITESPLYLTFGIQFLQISKVWGHRLR
jgi:hypothetical protein